MSFYKLQYKITCLLWYWQNIYNDIYTMCFNLKYLLYIDSKQCTNNKHTYVYLNNFEMIICVQLNWWKGKSDILVLINYFNNTCIENLVPFEGLLLWNTVYNNTYFLFFHDYWINIIIYSRKITSEF